MAWMYNSQSGRFRYPNGSIACTGYSGCGVGLNNPKEEKVPEIGPIPNGTYVIGEAFTHNVCGPVAMRLKPRAKMQRFGFLIHGDNGAHNHTASHGCIVLPLEVRLAVKQSPDKELVVSSE